MSRIYGLIGFPLGHSRSAEYFNGKFMTDGLTDYQYRLFPIPSILELNRILAENPNLAGLNVTIPYKEKIIPLLSEIDDEAKSIGSVNVVTVSREGGTVRMKGFNTDAEGFITTLPDIEKHNYAVILGTGGSAKTVAYALRKKDIDVIFVSRSKTGPEIISYKQCWEDPAILGHHTLVVNTTPLGMFPNTRSCPDIPYDLLGNRHLLYDLVYNPQETLFLQKGAERGARICTGDAMFVKQAELSYRIFTGADKFHSPGKA